ncbi:uncharacterized protein ACIBXB_000508 isoform 1-T5 [Morphnus guianensis]
MADGITSPCSSQVCISFPWGTQGIPTALGIIAHLLGFALFTSSFFPNPQAPGKIGKSRLCSRGSQHAVFRDVISRLPKDAKPGSVLRQGSEFKGCHANRALPTCTRLDRIIFPEKSGRCIAVGASLPAGQGLKGILREVLSTEQRRDFSCSCMPKYPGSSSKRVFFGQFGSPAPLS